MSKRFLVSERLDALAYHMSLTPLWERCVDFESTSTTESKSTNYVVLPVHRKTPSSKAGRDESTLKEVSSNYLHLSSAYKGGGSFEGTHLGSHVIKYPRCNLTSSQCWRSQMAFPHNHPLSLILCTGVPVYQFLDCSYHLNY